jgi:hypothetical protein
MGDEREGQVFGAILAVVEYVAGGSAVCLGSAAGLS